MCWSRTCAVRFCIGHRANVGNGSFRSSLRFIERYYKSGLAFPLRPVACSLPSEISGRRLAVPPLSCHSRLPPLSKLSAIPANTAGMVRKPLFPGHDHPLQPKGSSSAHYLFRLIASSCAGAITNSRTPRTSPSQHFQHRRLGHGVKPPLTSAAYLSCELRDLFTVLIGLPASDPTSVGLHCHHSREGESREQSQTRGMGSKQDAILSGA
jgi:hypothetical protein